MILINLFGSVKEFATDTLNSVLYIQIIIMIYHHHINNPEFLPFSLSRVSCVCLNVLASAS